MSAKVLKISHIPKPLEKKIHTNNLFFCTYQIFFVPLHAKLQRTKKILMKKLTFLLLSSMLMINVMAMNVEPNHTRDGITKTTILSEDFSKFTAGTDSEPDHIRLDNAETGVISDEYFNTSGWKGNEVYQAGGCAYLSFSEEYQETGIIITPTINTSGAIYINCRMRTVDPAGDIVGYNIVDENMELLDANVDFFKVTNEWTNISWFTSAGAENSRIYIYSYSKNVFIDDIEIVSVQLPTPTLLEETNISKNSFTANFNIIFFNKCNCSVLQFSCREC